jgi:signal peptidase
MEPVIQVNDGFIVLPCSKLKSGDIIMYRPVILQAPYITHRIIEITENGYITKGDNAPCKDQDNKEPVVSKDRIVGRVVTICGSPLVFCGLGKLASFLQFGLGMYSGKISVMFLVLSIITAIIPNHKSHRKKKTQYRLRLRHIYRVIVIIAVMFTAVTVYLGSNVCKIKYLVSEYPGISGDQVEVNKSGQLKIIVKNMGFFPTFTIISAAEPLFVYASPECIRPRCEEEVIINVLPQRRTGIYHGYIRICKYPALLPRTCVVSLHRLHPVIADIASSLTLGLWFHLFFILLNRIHGFENWIPLRAIKDKILYRRMKWAKTKILERRELKIWQYQNHR